MLFSEKKIKTADFNPLAVAYIGDTVYDLFVRTKILEKGNTPVHNMHKDAVRFVSASAQAKSMEALLPVLSDEEVRLYKWGRNAKSQTIPKNATVKDYRVATGFEVLVGGLYINDETERLYQLMNIAFEGLA